jgi:hypothetical protein
MSKDVPLPPLPDAPSAAITDNEVVLTLLTSTSPVPHLSHRLVGRTILFWGGAEKHLSDLLMAGYSPAKKKVGNRTGGAATCPCNADAFANDASDSNEDEDKGYSPTPTYKIVWTTRPKKRDAKITLDKSYFAFLCPTTFDTKQFIHGHPPVYSEEEMVQFVSNFQKQLLFNFSATCATWKKFTLMHEGYASHLCKVDLDVTPTSFSPETTNCHELSWYVLKDLLSCPEVGWRVIACIWVGANGNPTEQPYSDQEKCILESRKKNGIVIESWWMSGDSFYVLQGTISQATLYNKIGSKNLSQSRFMKYFANCSRDFGISCESCNKILSLPWHNVIEYSHTIMFFAKSFDQLRPWGPVFHFKMDPEYAHHVFCQFALEYFGNSRASSQLFATYKECLYSVYHAWCIAAESTSVETRSTMPNFNFKAARIFQLTLDNICRYSLLNCFSDFSDYSMPISRTSDFCNFLHASKHVFLQQWAFLSSHWNINQEQDG